MKKLFIIISLLSVSLGFSQEIEVGFQSSFPSYGPSVKFNLGEQSKGQVIIGSFGTVSSISGRYIKSLSSSNDISGVVFDPYVYGQLGSWTYDYDLLGIKDTSFGYGAGIGVDSSLLHFISENLNLGIEIGLGGVDLEYYDIDLLSFGLGIHFRL